MDYISPRTDGELQWGIKISEASKLSIFTIAKDIAVIPPDTPETRRPG